MSFLSLLPIIGKVIDRIIPDKHAAQKAKQELEVLDQKGELELMLKQIAINANESKHKSLFVAGWRPFIGWACGVTFVYHFLFVPLIHFIANLNGVQVDLPHFQVEGLMTVLLSMLGLGGLRTYEKLKGVSSR